MWSLAGVGMVIMVIWYGYLWKKSLGESCSPPIQWPRSNATRMLQSPATKCHTGAAPATQRQSPATTCHTGAAPATQGHTATYHSLHQPRRATLQRYQDASITCRQMSHWCCACHATSITCHHMSHWCCACHATSHCNVPVPAPATQSHAAAGSVTCTSDPISRVQASQFHVHKRTRALCTPPKTPKKLKKKHMNLEDTIPRSILWDFRKCHASERVLKTVVKTSTPQKHVRFRQDRISVWHSTSSNILFLFVRFHVCVCCWFFTITNLWDENSYVCNIPQTFASARATMKSSCPDSSHWKRLVPASCLLSHPCPSPTRRCSTPSLSNLWHLCHSCHLFLQHYNKLLKFSHVKSSNTFTNF